MIVICTWNIRRATKKSSAWDYFSKFNPDISLLQEINSIPEFILNDYSVLQKKALGKTGNPQVFSTVILVKGTINYEIELSTQWDWLNDELKLFDGNLLAANITLSNGESFNVYSVYSPAWPIDKNRLTGIDVTEVKLKNNPDIWATELLWASLLNQDLKSAPWIIGGDLNSSVTFDYMLGNQPRGNQEIQDRMTDMGFKEALASFQGQLTPTFRNPKGGKIIHQMDHVFLSLNLHSRLNNCYVGEHHQVFGQSLSDHLPIITELI